MTAYDLMLCFSQATVSAVEEKLSLSQSELQQVKASIKQYESLLDSYKIQVIISLILGYNSISYTVTVCREPEATLPLLNHIYTGGENSG